MFQGGPVQTDRGFVLHEPIFSEADKPDESVYASTMSIPGGLEMTTSKDVLEAMSNGNGPRRVLVSLGYSAWGEGQLESELGDNSWLTVAADLAVIFDTPVAAALRQGAGLARDCRPGCCRPRPAMADTHVRRRHLRAAGLQTFLALDFGTKRTGFASERGCWARPNRKARFRPQAADGVS